VAEAGVHDPVLDLGVEIRMSGLRLAAGEAAGELNSSLVLLSRITLGPVLEVLY
jgi:hypothetical protein